MNCKPGDLAICVGGRHIENVGRIVNVLRLHSDGEMLPGHRAAYERQFEPAWVVEAVGAPLWANIAGPQRLHVIRDSVLRPIRPDAGEDESLSWAGLPHKQGVPA